MKTGNRTKKFLFQLLIAFLFMGLYSCNCAKCLITPPPLDTYTSDLVSRNHAIDSATASHWIERYIANKDVICNDSVGAYGNILDMSGAFNKKYLFKLLCLNGCIGLRIHYGMDSAFVVHQIITGVDQYGNDLYFKLKPGDPPPLSDNPGVDPDPWCGDEAAMPPCTSCPPKR